MYGIFVGNLKILFRLCCFTRELPIYYLVPGIKYQHNAKNMLHFLNSTFNHLPARLQLQCEYERHDTATTKMESVATGDSYSYRVCILDLHFQLRSFDSRCRASDFDFGLPIIPIFNAGVPISDFGLSISDIQ